MIYESILAWRALILGFRIWEFQNWTQNEILDPVRFFRALKLDIWARLARKLLIFVRFLRENCDFGVKFAILEWNFENFRFSESKFWYFWQKIWNFSHFRSYETHKKKTLLKPHFIWYETQKNKHKRKIILKT